MRTSRWSDARLAQFEEDLFLSVYIIRKLAEATKLSDDLLSALIPVRRFRSRGRAVTRMNWHRVDELYRLETGQETFLPVRGLCNAFIHSYVLLPIFDDGRIRSVLVNADRDRNRGLFEVSLHEVVGLVEAAVRDQPTEATMVWNSERDDYDVYSGTRAMDEPTRQALDWVAAHSHHKQEQR